MIRLSELLAIRCFAPMFRGVAPEETRVKLVRHKDPNLDLEALRRAHIAGQPGSESWLDIYQKYQPTRVFENCDQIVVFMGEADYPDSRFIGVYDVGARFPAAQRPLPPGCPHPEWAHAPYYYELAKRTGLEDLENRLVIAWGRPGAGMESMVRRAGSPRDPSVSRKQLSLEQQKPGFTTRRSRALTPTGRA